MAVDYLDRGKTRLDVGDEIADDIAKTLRSVTKTIYKAEKRKRRAGRSSSYYMPMYSGPTLKDAVFEVLPDAIENATASDTYSVSTRDLYYVVRPLVANITSEKDLQYNYFSQTLIIQYEEDYGPIEGLYRDPRGVLYEPHTDKTVPLGTHDVAKYQFPDWTYNKILYIEKKGIAEQLKPSKLAERYDLAIIAAEGYATEACRTLLENAEAGDYYIYVLHDADPYGYNIALTLQEATRRMPGYSVDVIDLGLKVEEALGMGLPPEAFTRTKDIPWRVRSRLNSKEREYFIGEKISSRSWRCQRIELNAIPVPDRAAYIERKLHEADAPGKVIPSDEALPDLSKELYEGEVDVQVDEIINAMISSDDIKELVRGDLKDKIDLKNARQWIEAGFERDDSQWWRNIVKDKIESILSTHESDIETLIKKEISKIVDDSCE
jgi:hypothetical protein